MGQPHQVRFCNINSVSQYLFYIFVQSNKYVIDSVSSVKSFWWSNKLISELLKITLGYFRAEPATLIQAYNLSSKYYYKL